jgi:hypothetical protein
MVLSIGFPAFRLEGTKGDDAFMEIVFAVLRQAAVETYAALAADPSFVIAIAQAILSLWNRKVTRAKKEPPSSVTNSGGSFSK